MKISASPSKPNKSTPKERPVMHQQLGFAFEDVSVNDSDESQDSPPLQYIHSPPSKSSHRNNNNLHRNLKPDHFDQKLLAESMMEDDDDNDDDQINSNVPTRRIQRSSSHRSSLNGESSDVLFLLDANENLTVR